MGRTAKLGSSGLLALIATWSPCASALAGPEGMVGIDGGEFDMGSNAPDTPNTEKPEHCVRVDGFWIDAHEITNAQFRAFVIVPMQRLAAQFFKTLQDYPPSQNPGAFNLEKIQKQIEDAARGR